jgi:hypothetical protein
MVMAPGGNLPGNSGGLLPANMPFTPGSTATLPIQVNSVISPTGVVIDGGGVGTTFQNGAVVFLTVGSTGNPGLYVNRGGLYLAGGNGTAISAGALWAGAGAPGPGLGNNGDFYFRNDTPGTANQRIYIKSANTWTGLIV